MQNPWKVIPLLLLATAFTTVNAVPAPIKSPAGMPLEAAENHMMQGELVKVDTDKQTFTIKLENGEEIQFQYDSNTKVEGRENGVQGLSTESGSHLTVHYTERSGKRMATRIEIKERESR